VIVAAPAETPVATHEEPFTDTVAIGVLELAQLASVGVGAVPPDTETAYVAEAPTFTVEDDGVMLITSGGGGLGVTGTNPSPPPPHDASSTADNAATHRPPFAPNARGLTARARC
jgi:hypothetical protein